MDIIVPASVGEAEIVEKRSRFIAVCAPAETEQQALAVLAAQKKKYPDARHHVYAYSLRAGSITRYTDDGEPQGTAGPPVLARITGRPLCDAVVVVTRYFGGTLLGRGGLTHAYADAAAAAIEKAGRLRLASYERFCVDVPYHQYESLRRACESCGGEIESADFGSSVVLDCFIPETRADSFCGAVSELTLGRCRPLPLGKTLRGEPIE